MKKYIINITNSLAMEGGPCATGQLVSIPC